MSKKKFTESVKSMRNRTVRLDRHGDYWTDQERKDLERDFNGGEGITTMALKFQRTESAVIQQIESMDLYGRKKNPATKKPKEPYCLCKNCKLDPALCPHKECCPKLHGGF